MIHSRIYTIPSLVKPGRSVLLHWDEVYVFSLFPTMAMTASYFCAAIIPLPLQTILEYLSQTISQALGLGLLVTLTVWRPPLWLLGGLKWLSVSFE